MKPFLQAVEEKAKRRGCRTCIQVTTNDNLNARGIHQKKGAFSEVILAAMEES